MKQDTKERIQYGSAVAMIATGIVLSCASFVWLRAIHNSVLAFVGEAVGFAGAVFGLAVFTHTKSRELDERFERLREELRKEGGIDGED